MAKIILLVFVHGFKGGKDTFGSFPDELVETLNTKKLEAAQVEYRGLVYPAYDTRGNFVLAVTKLREWTLGKVIDLEAELGTRNPMLTPNTYVVYLGHSMGGLVASDVAVQLHEEAPLPGQLFPRILGLVCLDSPMLGIAPSLWTNQATDLLSKGQSWYNTATTFGALSSGLLASKTAEKRQIKDTPAAKSSAWGWKAIAAASTAGALVAAGAGYASKDHLARGFSWITDHIEFISILRDEAGLSKRTVAVNSIDCIQFVCFYTVIPKTPTTATDRTFVVLPKGALLKSRWIQQENKEARDEIAAHTSMFRTSNTGYITMLEQISALLNRWQSESMFIKLPEVDDNGQED
jgi:pimeloyl-ACP methyl ester carboxylesterase